MSPFYDIALFFVGLMLYSITENPKVNEVGRIMLFCGLLAFCLIGLPHSGRFL